MLRYFARRTGYAVVLLLAVVTLNFLLIHISPGDPVETIAGSMGGISEELRAQLRAQYGLDRPFLVQLGLYLGQVARGDLGHSYFFNLPVAQLIWERVPATLLLVVTAVLSAFLAGTALGTLAARKPNGPLSQGITLLSIVGYSAPVFWTGIILIILFASLLPWFPVSDMRSAGGPEHGWAGVLDVLHHLVLPAFTLAFVYLAQYSRLARASVMDALAADYIRTARAKGLAEPRVLFRHALRNAAVPIITVVGSGFAMMVSGVVITESVFNIPGIGRLVVDSALSRDYALIQALILLTGVLYVVINLLIDLAYALTDPRIRYQ